MSNAHRGRVICVRSSLSDRDVRLPKEMKALRKAAYTICVICWDRECKRDKVAAHEECEEIRFRFKAPWGIAVLPFLPIWWCFVFIRLMVARWDAVHAVNFDCVVPSLVAGRLKRKPVVYEILDVYADQMTLPRAMRAVCISVDRLFMRFASAIVVADEAQVEEVGGIPNRMVFPIYDSPPDALIQSDAKRLGFQSNETFTLFYAGVLYRARQLNLDRVFELVQGVDETKLVVAGYGDLVNEIEHWNLHMPDKVEFLGQISYEEVIKRGMEADLFFALRDTIVPANRYTCGSTLFNAMICGRPILANKGGSTATKVLEHNCGLVVDANNIDEIREAIIRLRDAPRLCKELGANARRAYEERYGWGIMERRLLALYHELTGGAEQGAEQHS